MAFRAVITGGGTGGHIYPALAVAEVLRQDPDCEALLYMGKIESLESELVPAQDISFVGISFYGMPREKTLLLPFRLFRWFIDLRRAVKQARKRLKEFKPDVAFGTGGYVSAPVLIAARELKIPYIVHEPDAHPGLVNQLTARHASLVTAAFGDAEAHFKLNPSKTTFEVTGNPLRGKLGCLSRSESLARLGLSWDESRPILAVIGGSQGARTLNRTTAEALPYLIDDLGLRVIHQTGKKLYDETVESLPEGYFENPNYCIQPYYADMPAVWSLADVALCRAGSLTLSELYLSGTPSILVPYPYAAADHQRKNAEASVRSGASIMLDDPECTGEKLLEQLELLLTYDTRLRVMADSAQSLAHPEATARIVAHLKRVAGISPDSGEPSGKTLSDSSAGGLA